MDEDMESGALGSYHDRPRTFPNMRTKAYTPLVNSMSDQVYSFLLVISNCVVVEIVHLYFSADISCSTGYKCSCVVCSFTAGIWSCLLLGGKNISDYCVCHFYLYSQLLCGDISYEVGAC